MKLGRQLASTSWECGARCLGATLIEVVEAAEAAGFDAIDVSDHLWQHPILGGPEASQLEAYTTLGFIAARTRRVRLLALATAVSYRHAGLLAKIVTTLDVLSGGRTMLGLGAGDYPDEARGLGLPFPPLRERFALLEETVRACLRMWAGERGDERPLRGQYVHLERPLNLPQSLSRPHPPILIAGRASNGHCRWSPATPTPATYAPRPRSRGSWSCCAASVSRRAATTRRSRGRPPSASTSARAGRRSAS